MTKRFSLLLLAAMCLLSTLSTFAQKVGTPYDSREPHTCPDMSKPVKGPITAAQAKQYFICGMEHISSYQLYLVEDVTVTVGRGTVFQARNFPYASDIDPTFPVYPIRVSYKQYQCNAVSAIMENKGKNATLYVVEKATGVCVRTTFGDWRCTATGDWVEGKTQRNVPAPK